MTIGEALRDHLAKSGRTLTSVQFEDRPDLRMLVDGLLNGFELVQIPPRRVMEMVHTRFRQLKGEGAKFIRVVWPQEPDHWVEEAIKDKQKKLDAYRKNLGTDRVSLVIHTPVGLKEPLVRVSNPAVMSLIRSAATHTTNHFDAIYFWDSSLGIEKMSPTLHQWPRMQVTFDDGYPTDGLLIGTTPFTTTKEGEPPTVYDYGVIEPRVLLVPPQSPEFLKRKAKFKNPKQHVIITARATDASIAFTPVDE